MKSISKSAILFIATVLLSCTSDSDVILKNPTELEVAVLGASGQPVRDAEVRIFRNRRDWESLTREVDIQYTDDNGIAHFIGLQSANYFFYARYENGNEFIDNQFLNADFGEVFGSNFELADFLTENGITGVSVNAIYSHPVTVSNFQIIDVQVFLESETAFVEERSDTAEIVMLNLENYDFQQDINDQLDKVVSDYGFNNYFNRFSNDIGEYEYFTPTVPFEYDIESLVTNPETYELLLLEVDPFDGTYYFEPVGGAIINEVAYGVSDGEARSFRYKDAGRFNFGNDSYVIDLIIDWY